MRAERKAAFYDKEILKYFVGTEAVKNVVIDANKVVANSDGRFIVEAGNVLQKVGGESKLVKPITAAEESIAAADIVGVMAHTVEFFGINDHDYDEPAAAFFWNAIFDTTKLIGYTKNATNVKAALVSCRFE